MNGIVKILLVFLHLAAEWILLEHDSNQYSFIVRYRELQHVNDDIKYEYQRHFNKTAPVNTKRGMPIHCTGSMSEGSFLANFFREDFNQHNISYDFDIERTYFAIPPRFRKYVQDDQINIGFLKLRVNFFQNCTECQRTFFYKYSDKNRILMELVGRKNYLSSNKLKRLLVSGQDGDEKKVYEYRYFFKSLFDVPVEDISTNLVTTMTKSTSKQTLTVQMNNSSPPQNYIIELDTASLIQLQWLAPPTIQWMNRKKNWPDLLHLRNELKVSYIIAKPLKEEGLKEESEEFSYSFGHLERRLTELRSDHQDLVYMIFKSLFYKWIHSIEPNSITSYFAKTVMLWTCEKYPPQHPMWQETEISTLKVLKYLVRKLLIAFQKKHLPYYFIPSINVMKYVQSDVSREVVNNLSNILIHIEKFVPLQEDTDQFKKVKDTGVGLLKILRVMNTVFLDRDILPYLEVRHLELYSHYLSTSERDDKNDKLLHCLLHGFSECM